ncbi:MAG: hypothetical protein ACYC6L_09615, partial [Anaerolineae bacterium]
IGILLLVTLGRLRELLRVLKDEVQPVLLSLQDAFRTVRGTAHIVSDTVVNPLVKVNSVSTGAMRALMYFFNFGRKSSSASATRDQSQGQKAQE